MRMAIVLLAVGVLPGVHAQTAPPAPSTVVEKLAAEWQDSARKLTAMAAEFPEDKYDYKPTPQVRTFAAQLLHVAFWNNYVEQTALGKEADSKTNELPRSQYKTKAQVVDVVRKSFDGAIAALKASSEEAAIKNIRLWTTFLEHNGEHYGQMVMYYRLSGLVPPESRKQ